MFMGTGAAVTYGLLFVSLYFEVFLLVTFLQRRSRDTLKKGTENLSRFPSVAIVVPCFNVEKTVVGTIESLLALTYPKDKLEIILVNDGSTDGTGNAIQVFSNTPRVRMFSKENGGKHTAMNLALINTNAELIGCLDADSFVASDALSRIVSVFENKKIAAVTPGIHVKKPENMLQIMQHVEYRLSVFNRFVFAALGSVFITPGPFSFFRAHVVRELGGWNYGHATEDMEMALRIQKAGHLIANAPAASVYTVTPRTLPALFRQRVRWTYGFLRNLIDYGYMFGNRRYGNLGLFILPTALISIAAGIFFFVRIVWYGSQAILDMFERFQVVGISMHPSFDPFYINTSVMLFLVYVSIGLILTLICIGSYIGTGSKLPPAGTPLFLLFYSFLVPLWLSTAVVRAIFKTGVQWR